MADNETDVDLLGFQFLVDEMVVALTEQRLLPLTLGLLGDWGAGKSSLLRLTQQQLENEEARYVVVPFSPWQCESHDDVKAALMSAILDRLESEAAQAAEEQQAQVRRLRRFTDRVLRSGRTAAARLWPTAATVGAGLIDPAAGEMVGQFQQGAASLPGTVRDDNGAPEDGQDAKLAVTVASFRGEFANLLDDLHGVAAVVVLIDDLDRCLPHTVVDTFEAIRLFLNVPKTAFVVAAHQKIVESAIDLRYPGMTEDSGSGSVPSIWRRCCSSPSRFPVWRRQKPRRTCNCCSPNSICPTMTSPECSSMSSANASTARWPSTSTWAWP